MACVAATSVPVASFAACGGGSTTSDSTGLSACTWPARFGPTDATTAQSTAGRYYLSCEGSNGGGALCPSNDRQACPGPNPTPGVTYYNCVDLCHDGEYALSCFVGPGPAPPVPAGCRQLPPSPATASYCCPCGA